MLLSYFEGLVFVVAALSLVLFFRNKKRQDSSRRWPPGPSPLPIIGNLHQVQKPIHTTFQNWAKKYGPLVSVKFGNQVAIIISSQKLIKELFSENVASGRIQNPISGLYCKGNYGIINAEGTTWEEQRRYTMRRLKDFGFASRYLEGLILEEAVGMTKYFEKRLGGPICAKQIFNGSVVSTLWHIVSGQRNEKAEGEQTEILKQADAMIKGGSLIVESGLLFAPFLRYIAPDYSGWNFWNRAVRGFTNLTDKAVEEHVEEMQKYSKPPVDFIDYYLQEIQDTKNEKSSFFKAEGRTNLTAVVSDLFLGGSETTSTSLEWAFLYLSYNMEVQKRIHAELDQVVGSRLPSLSDRPLLPYTEAVMMETFRLSSVFALSVPHRLMADKEFQSYLLPKDAILFANLYTIHRDPSTWGHNVNEFEPERFLSEDKSQVIRHEALIPFNIGKRQCPGETVARDTFFLFIACILQKFEIHPDPERDTPDFEGEAGFMRQPKSFNIIMTRRE